MRDKILTSFTLTVDVIILIYKLFTFSVLYILLFLKYQEVEES